MFIIENPTLTVQGQIQDLMLGGGRTYKNCAERREARKFWGISCEKSRFYANKIIFFPIVEGGAKICGVFGVKNHNFTQKNLIFSNCGGRREYFGVFRVKNHNFTPKNHIFSTFRGKRWVRPHGSVPAVNCRSAIKANLLYFN
jgi:hypothetical protein